MLFSFGNGCQQYFIYKAYFLISGDNMKKLIILLLALAIFVQTATTEDNETLTITINEPESKTYNAATVPIDIETSLIADNISYILDTKNETGLCSNCSSITGELTNLEEGSHTLEVIATKDNESIGKTVIFDVELEEPEPEVDAIGRIEIEIKIKGGVSSEQLTLIQPLINSIIGNIRNLKIEIKTEGPKIKTKVKGYLTDEELETLNDLVESLENNGKVKIEIKTKIKKPKFDKGFNKLPKQFKDGKISEEELIELLKKNKFPPGVIKRLVKEGLSGFFCLS